MSHSPTARLEIGYLTDGQIRKQLEAGQLIEEGTWSKDQIRHASYTLRLGDRIEIARASSTVQTKTKEFTIVPLTKDNPRLELMPGDTALLYSKEHLKFSKSILGFTVARGVLFAEALSPENTYVDPGFTGSIYTTVTNVSNRQVHLEYEMPIARLFFFQLSEPVEDGYKSGSALGISQQLSSVRAGSISSLEDCRNATNEQLAAGIRLIPIGGVHAAESIDRLSRRHVVAMQRMGAFAFLWPALLLLANNNDWIKANLGAFVGNVSASIVAAALVWFAPTVLKWAGGGNK